MDGEITITGTNIRGVVVVVVVLTCFNLAARDDTIVGDTFTCDRHCQMCWKEFWIDVSTILHGIAYLN